MLGWLLVMHAYLYYFPFNGARIVRRRDDTVRYNKCPMLSQPYNRRVLPTSATAPSVQLNLESGTSC